MRSGFSWVGKVVRTPTSNCRKGELSDLKQTHRCDYNWSASIQFCLGSENRRGGGRRQPFSTRPSSWNSSADMLTGPAGYAYQHHHGYWNHPMHAQHWHMRVFWLTHYRFLEDLAAGFSGICWWLKLMNVVAITMSSCGDCNCTASHCQSVLLLPDAEAWALLPRYPMLSRLEDKPSDAVGTTNQIVSTTIIYIKKTTIIKKTWQNSTRYEFFLLKEQGWLFRPPSVWIPWIICLLYCLLSDMPRTSSASLRMDHTPCHARQMNKTQTNSVIAARDKYTGLVIKLCQHHQMYSIILWICRLK